VCVGVGVGVCVFVECVWVCVCVGWVCVLVCVFVVCVFVVCVCVCECVCGLSLDAYHCKEQSSSGGVDKRSVDRAKRINCYCSCFLIVDRVRTPYLLYPPLIGLSSPHELMMTSAPSFTMSSKALSVSVSLSPPDGLLADCSGSPRHQ
jgi:hypothetical protein